MRQETRTCTVSVTAEELWDYLADYDNVVRLASPTGAAAPVLPDREGERPRYRASVLWEGIESRFHASLVAADRPSSLTWEGSSTSAVASVRFDLTPRGRVTELEATVLYRASDDAMPLEPFAWGLIRPMFGRMMSKLSGLERRDLSARP